jgi:hypothetical protein
METTTVTLIKGAVSLGKYLGLAGQSLREQHWQTLWDHFWDETDPSKREEAVARLCADNEPRFAAWLFGLFVQVNEKKTMTMLGKWTVHVGLGDKPIDFFYRGARGITQTFAEDLESLLVYAAIQAEPEMRPEIWEAIVLAGFARRSVSTQGFAFDSGSEMEAQTRFEITELGVEFLASQGIAWPPK